MRVAFLIADHFPRLYLNQDRDCHELSLRLFVEFVSVEVIIPSSVEVLGERCFEECRSLCSVIFESGSRLWEVGEGAFLGVSIHPTLPQGNAAFDAQTGNL
jgi:hypothetical protein